jgi:nitrite reductase/ring-hydroxylating ferredoxin subunit
MSRDTLIELMRRTVAHGAAGTLPLAEDVRRIPAGHYCDADRWRLEMDRVFRRAPLVMAFSCELRSAHSYKAMEVAGTPVLITRGADGRARAFVNMCSHRGAQVVQSGTTGASRRLTCPYHAWTYDSDGALVGVLDREHFGELDSRCLGLTPLPCSERAGIVFVGLTPSSSIDIDTYLCGYGDMLEHLQLADCTLVGRQWVEGPNWKVAYDGYLDFYHLPVLHKRTFGPDFPNRAIYDAWGPHQFVTSPDPRAAAALAAIPEDHWTDELLTMGVWTIFPHTSIASFPVAPDGVEGGGRIFMVSTLFPGDTPDSSITVQSFLACFEPCEALLPAIEAQQSFLLGVVRDEDYLTGNGIQRAAKTGAKSEFLFGRNEGGGQRFHGWVDRLVAAECDDDFVREFEQAEVVFAR